MLSDFLCPPLNSKGDFFMSVQNALSKKQSNQQKVKNIVMSALFCALAYVTMFVFRIRVAGFLTFDAKDAIITLSGLLFGPLSSLAISLTVAFIEMISVSTTGLWGFLMNFLASATFSCTAAIIYKYKHNIKGAILGLVCSVFSTTAMMLILNLLITPIYTGSSTAAIAGMIPTILFPFNLTKSVLNASLVLVLYKPISRAMKATGIVKIAERKKVELTREEKKRKRILNFVVFGIGALLVAASILVFVFILGGNIKFFDK